jgi:hypothetical protein
MLFLLVFSGVLPVHADDKPRLFKRGGVPHKDRWKEADVKNYLRLPYLTSIDDIANRLEAVQSIGEHRIVKNKNRPFKPDGKKSGTISFELHGDKSSVFHVTVYDHQSWNSACDKLFGHATSTIAMWNKIPDYYSVKRNNDTCTITRNGKYPQKWHFELKKLFAIGVFSKVRQENAKSEKEAIAQMDQAIQRLVAVIDGKDNDAAGRD